MSTPILLGVDIGTSDSKVLVTTLDGSELGSVAVATKWVTRQGIYTETDAEALADGVLALLGRAADQTAREIGPVTVVGIAATGMAEGGVLLDGDKPTHPIMAWFDPRGGDELAQLPAQLIDEFPGRTGLPASPLATTAKLAWMRGQGTDLAGLTWLNVPEFIIHRLGGARAAEWSLTARTGLLDQDSEQLWPELLAALGADASLIPPRVLAGTPLGRVSGDRAPAVLRGAVLAVAGHDHPVAAVGSGVVGDDEVFDSFGTAEALVRTVGTGLDRAARNRLATAGINSVHHVLAGRRLLLGGTKGGLLLRRTLDMLGANGFAGREQLDEAACRLQDSVAAIEGITVRGAANDDGTLRIAVTANDVSPGSLWLATLAHAVDEATRCLSLMESEVGATAAATVGGGWSRMRSVRRSKVRSLPNVRFSDRTQAGALGAAMFAAHAHRHAELLATHGDRSAIAIDHPTGPSADFADRFTQVVGRSAAPAPSRHEARQLDKESTT